MKRCSPRRKSSSWVALLLALAGLLFSGAISVAQAATSSNELREPLGRLQSIEQLDQAEQKILRFIEGQRESEIVEYWWEPDGIGMRFENGKIGVAGLRSSGNPKTNPALQLPSQRLSAQAIEGSIGEDVVADAEVWQGAPDLNFGTISGMLIGFDSSDATLSYGIFMPSFNSIPGNACSISMAQLIVDVVDIIEPGNISAHAVVSGSSNFWSETSITWNNRPDLEPGALSTVNISSAGLVEFSVTTVAQEWFSGSRDINGIYLRAPSAAFINVSTRESSDDPTFYYEYETCTGEPPDIETFGTGSISSESALLQSNLMTNGSDTNVAYRLGTSSGNYNTFISHEDNPFLGSGPTTQFADQVITGLNCEQTYFWQPLAENEFGSDIGSEAQFTTSQCPQDPPSAITDAASGIGQEFATLNATINPNGASTEARFKYGLTSALGQNTTWQTLGSGGGNISHARTITGLQCDKAYQFRVEARNSGGQSNGSIRSFSTNACPEPIPGTPGSIDYPPSSSSGNFTVSWSSVSGATSYQLARSSNGGSTWSTIFNGSATSRAQSLGDGSYRYRARACNSSGCSNWRTGTFDIVVDISDPIPGTPGSINYPSSSSTGNFTVSWSGVSGATSYQLARSSNSGSTWSTIFTGSSTSRAQSLGDGSYRYRARACNSSGCSNWRTGSFDIVVDPDVIFLDDFEQLQPVFGNDRIYFSSNQDGDFDIFSMQSDGSDIRPFLSGPGDQRRPKFSSDGSYVAFLDDASGTLELRVLQLSSGLSRSFAPLGSFEWMPERRALSGTLSNGPCSRDLAILNLDTMLNGNLVIVLDETQRLNLVGIEPLIGDRLIYTTDPCWSPSDELRVLDLPTGESFLGLPANGKADEDGDMSFDGSIVFAESEAGFNELRRIQILQQGQPLRRLTSGDGGPERHPVFSPNGQFVLFVRRNGAEDWDLYSIDIATNVERLLLDTPMTIMDPIWFSQ